MVRRAFCVALIALGAGLDAYFYVFRFTADGTNIFVAIAAALALEILLAFAVINAQKSNIFTGLAVALTLFAVVQTSAGQTFSLLARDATAGDVSGTVQRLMAEEQKSLDRIDAERATITAQLKSVQTVEGRAAYGVTVGSMTRRLSELAKEQAAATSRLSALAEKNGASETAQVKSMSIYDFYASMPGWQGMDWLKFIFHTIFSLFIAVMTPVGLLTWSPRTAARILKKSSLTEKEVHEFVSRCWKKLANGTGEKILSEKAFTEWTERDGVIVSPGVYSECVKRALALNIITREGIALVKDERLIEQKILKGA